MLSYRCNFGDPNRGFWWNIQRRNCGILRGPGTLGVKARKPSGLGESPGEGEDRGKGRHASFLERSVVISPSPGRLGTHTLHLRLSVLRGDCQLWCEGGHGAGWNGSLQNSSVPGGGRLQAFLSTSKCGLILTKLRECSFLVKGKVWWTVSQVKRVDNCCIIRQHFTVGFAGGTTQREGWGWGVLLPSCLPDNGDVGS